MTELHRLVAGLGRRPRVGLLGGSFNPAHAGHRYISLLAVQRLGLDRVWWLVSPQNPLKPIAGMATLAARLAEARRRAGRGPIRVSDVERALGTRYTVDTVAALKRRYPHIRFVWLMGADNLADLVRWRRWPELMQMVAVAIFDRPTYLRKALSAPVARRFARFRVCGPAARQLADRAPPVWSYIQGRPRPESSTALRACGKWTAGPAMGA